MVPLEIFVVARACSPRIESAVTLLPLPDSPTTPTQSPASTSSETSSIAVTQPVSTRNWTVRLRMARSGAIKSIASLQAGVEHVAERVAEQIEAQCGEADGDAGKQHHPPGLGGIVAAFGDDVAPACDRRLNTNAEKTERRFRQHRIGKDEGQMHQQRAEAIGQDVPH